MLKSRTGTSMRVLLALAPIMTWGAARAADEPVAAPAGASTEASTEAAPATASGATALGATAPAAAHPAPHGQHAAHRTPEQALDERVAGLGKVLGLDDGQKSEIRKILMVQQSQLRQVWSDPARSSADRIGVSQSINKQTEDRIRSVLTEAQRQQYIASRPAGAATGHPEHGLDYWMDQMQGRH